MHTYETPELLTIPETAALLRQSRSSVYRKITRGAIPAVRVGYGRRAPLRVPRAELNRWLYEVPTR